MLKRGDTMQAMNVWEAKDFEYHWNLFRKERSADCCHLQVHNLFEMAIEHATRICLQYDYHATNNIGDGNQ